MGPKSVSAKSVIFFFKYYASSHFGRMNIIFFLGVSPRSDAVMFSQCSDCLLVLNATAESL